MEGGKFCRKQRLKQSGYRQTLTFKLKIYLLYYLLSTEENLRKNLGTDARQKKLNTFLKIKE